MITFNEFLTESVLNERFYNLFKKDDKDKYKDEAFHLLQKAYEKVGGIKGNGFSSPDDMAKNIPFWKLAIKNGKIVAGVFYKDKSGRKRVASFTDGSQVGIDQLSNIMKNDLDRAFMEVSERSFGFMRKLMGDDVLLKYAVKPEKAKQLLKEKDDEFKFDVPADDTHIQKAPKLKDYFYQRKIGGHFHTKIMLGKHGNVITEQDAPDTDDGVEIIDFFNDYNDND